MVKTYDALKAAGKNFEVIFVSSDQDLDGFEEYFGSMPWKAVPFENEDLRQEIGNHFGVRGIPQLIILNSEAKIISKDGRTEVTKDKEKAFDKWSAAASA